MNSIIVECKNLSKSFYKKSRKTVILDNLNFNIYNNEIVSIKGKSGAGKSVLLWLIAALDKPTSGEIIIDNVNINELNESRIAEFRRNALSIIFQDFNLLPSFTAYENVLSALEYSKYNKAQKKERALYYLEKVGLKSKINNFPVELSYGQRQRVAIARSIITEPKILIADEPTGGLDSKTEEEIITILAELVNHNNSTLIIASHGDNILKFSNRVLTLENNNILNEILPN